MKPASPGVLGVWGASLSLASKFLLHAHVPQVGESWYTDNSCSRLCSCSTHNISCLDTSCKPEQLCWALHGLIRCRSSGMRPLSMPEDPPATKTSSPQFPLILSSLPSIWSTPVCGPAVQSFWWGEMTTALPAGKDSLKSVTHGSPIADVDLDGALEVSPGQSNTRPTPQPHTSLALVS